jgi:hypothetical protein
MAGGDFFETLFGAGFWDDIDQAELIEDDQSHLADAEVLARMIAHVRPEHVVEIGSWKGHSANFMADRCRELGLPARIVCVDTFLGSAEHWALPHLLPSLHRRNGRATLYERFLANTLARGNRDRLFPLPLDSANAAAVLGAFNFRADLIYVDGGHGYENVCADINAYWPLLSERGLLFGDDYGWKMVRRAVHDRAEALGVDVVVSGAKWLYLKSGKDTAPEGFEPRPSAGL